MSFYISRTDKRNETHNSLVLRRTKLAHISVLLRSNSGAIPLSNRSYKLFIRGKEIEGTTDEDGLIEHSKIPPGDYEIEIEGLEGRMLMPTLPNHISRCPLRVTGFFLFEENNAEDEDDELTEEEMTLLPIEIGDEDDDDSDDWEEIAVYEDEDEND